MSKLPALALLTSLYAPAALAQDDEVERTDERAAARTFDEEIVREVVRGYYMKADIGSTLYLLTHGSGVLSGVMTVNLTVGGDFLDNERSSAAWEVILNQSLQNGLRFETQAGNIPPGAYIQGDVHTIAGLAGIEASIYPSKRLGLGVRAGGGVMFIPLLIFPSEYQETVIPALGGVDPGKHGTPLPMGYGGPTLEYYTKLSHFSVGLDVEVSYVVGLNDLGVSPLGFMKYTF